MYMYNMCIYNTYIYHVCTYIYRGGYIYIYIYYMQGWLGLVAYGAGIVVSAENVARRSQHSYTHRATIWHSIRRGPKL